MITKVISLPEAKDRQEKINVNFILKKVNYDLVGGVEPNDIIFENSTPPSYTFLNKKFLINKNNLLKYTQRNWIRFGEIAALMAHYNLWKELQNDNNNNVYLICEDDCLPSELFSINKLNNFNYNEIDFLYLQAVTAHHQDKKHLINSLPVFKKDNNLKLINAYKNYICEGLAAYCITKKGAKKLCDYIEQNGYDGPVDNIITRLDNFECVCPSNLDEYFYLDETSSYSYTHSGNFFNKYDLSGIELQSKNNLRIQ